MERRRIVIESPLKGDLETNRRYATWCCRYMHEQGYAPIASHLVAPWFMDDRVPADREAGINMPWFWLPGDPHYFFVDLGESSGMTAARVRCISLGLPVLENCRLPARYFELHQDGHWPPHTPGFGPEVSVLPRGWCDPEHPNFDQLTFDRALAEQAEFDRWAAAGNENQKTAELLETLREVLVPRTGD